MAVVQVVADRSGISLVAVADDDGYYYFQFGAWRLYTGTGTPEAIITAPLGSLYVEKGSGVLYINDDGATSWPKVGTQS